MPSLLGIPGLLGTSLWLAVSPSAEERCPDWHFMPFFLTWATSALVRPRPQGGRVPRRRGQSQRSTCQDLGRAQCYFWMLLAPDQMMFFRTGFASLGVPHLRADSNDSVQVALFVAFLKMVRGKRWREHEAWGKFLVAFGCFDPIRYVSKFVLREIFDMDPFLMYHFVLTLTPIVYIFGLIYKCGLHRLYRVQDIWWSILFAHYRAYFCEFWIRPRDKVHAH